MTAAVDKRRSMSVQVMMRNGLCSSESRERESSEATGRGKMEPLRLSSGGGNLLQREMIPMLQC